MTAKVTLTAQDTKVGMTFEELEVNMARAREMGMTEIHRVQLTWSGKIQAITLREGPKPDDINAPDTWGDQDIKAREFVRDSKVVRVLPNHSGVEEVQ